METNNEISEEEFYKSLYKIQKFYKQRNRFCFDSHLKIMIDELLIIPISKFDEPINKAIIKLLLTGIDNVDLSVRARNCLKNMEIKTFGEILLYSKKDFLNMRKVGKETVNEIEELVFTKGFNLQEEKKSITNNSVEEIFNSAGDNFKVKVSSDGFNRIIAIKV